ncbi:hypothetical protein VTO73DRAFT_3133 [Trametes versicolor]
MWTDGEQGVRLRMKKRRKPHPPVFPGSFYPPTTGPWLSTRPLRFPLLQASCLAHIPPTVPPPPLYVCPLSHQTPRRRLPRMLLILSLHHLPDSVLLHLVSPHLHAPFTAPHFTFTSRAMQCSIPRPTFTPRSPPAPHEPTTSPSTTLTPTLGPRPTRVPALALPQDDRDDVAKTTRPGSSYLFCSCPIPCDYACALSICSEPSASAVPCLCFVFRVRVPLSSTCPLRLFRVSVLPVS